MKKTLFFSAAIVLAAAASAQKMKMRDARDYLSDKNYRKAIPTLNDVVVNSDTKDNAEAWYLRGMAYLQAAVDSTSGIPNAADESYTSLMKAVSLKPDYPPNEINGGLYSVAVLSFNQGVQAYSDTAYKKAYGYFMRDVAIMQLNNDQRFARDPNLPALTDIVKRAVSSAAYCAYYAKNDEAAIAMFTQIRQSPGNTDSNVYAALVDIYQRQKKDAEAMAVITEGRKKFPGDERLRNLELNYYINSGQQDVLLNKLVDAVAVDPNNAELQFNLGNAYEKAAYPKDASGKAGAKPANFNDLFGKAEGAYGKALAINGGNASYNYNAGVIYYERAAELNTEMNTIDGLTDAEKKKYDALLAERNTYFDKAQGFFEKSYGTLDAEYTKNPAAMKSKDDFVTYQSVMIGLREIYSRRDKSADAAKLKAKLEALK